MRVNRPDASYARNRGVTSMGSIILNVSALGRTRRMSLNIVKGEGNCMRGGRGMIDRWECQPEDWSDPPERDDLEEGRDDWADRARPGRERCSGCGEEWSVGDDGCKCEEGDGE